MSTIAYPVFLALAVQPTADTNAPLFLRGKNHAMRLPPLYLCVSSIYISVGSVLAGLAWATDAFSVPGGKVREQCRSTGDDLARRTCEANGYTPRQS